MVKGKHEFWFDPRCEILLNERESKETDADGPPQANHTWVNRPRDVGVLADIPTEPSTKVPNPLTIANLTQTAAEELEVPLGASTKVS